jgi:CRISPR-associated protein (TIGR02584 family)
MARIFLATLGQRPEAITVALDALSQDYTFDAAAILHTFPKQKIIGEALRNLRHVLASDYPRLRVYWPELRGKNDTPLLDITDNESAWDYYNALLAVLLQYKQQNYDLHLLVAGGRKAMSIYAALAAALVLNNADHLWTVISPDEVLRQPGQFHVKPDLRDQVKMIDLPILPARLVFSDPDKPMNIETVIQMRRDRCAHFISLLSKAEKALIEVLKRHPYATVAEPGIIMHKSERTIENQLRHIYTIMESYFDFDIRLPQTRKKQVLLDILMGHR